MMISNGYDASLKRPELQSEQVWVYRPVEGRDWTYSHHQSIAHYRNRYYAIWSNGKVNEDDPGQRVLVSSSPDFVNWTPPVPLIGTLQGKHSDLVLTAAGFHQYAGRLVAYVGVYEYAEYNLIDGMPKTLGKGHLGTALLAVTTDDGESWSDPTEMHIPIVPNHGPQPTPSGRLIISGNISFPYTDDPSGLTGWTMTGIYPSSMSSTIYDDSEAFWKVQKAAGFPYGLCEGSFLATDDGVLHMLLRSVRNPNARLWVTESTDDGTTWTPPVESDFTDNNTKFHFGRLPNGAFYYVGSPDPHGRRCPLVLSLSEDGARFDRHFILAEKVFERRVDRLHKGGVYGYPHTMIHDGHLYVICSVCKEDVLALRVPCDTL